LERAFGNELSWVEACAFAVSSFLRCNALTRESPTTVMSELLVNCVVMGGAKDALKLNAFLDDKGALLAALEAHIVAAGRNAVALAVAPDQIVPRLLELNNNYQTLLSADCGLMTALDKALRTVVNSGVPDGVKVELLLAKHCDAMLRRQTADEMAVCPLALYTFLEEKDLFELALERLVAKRLIECGRSGEQRVLALALVGRLKCRLRRHRTAAHARRCCRVLESQRGVWCMARRQRGEVLVWVVAQCVWPLMVPSTRFVVPLVLVRASMMFRDFYRSKFGERKLEFVHRLGQVDVAVNYAVRPLHVAVSTAQFAVLALFDTAESDCMTLGELQDASKLDVREFEEALRGMLKCKFVSRSAASWDAATVVSLVKDFKSAHNRVLLHAPTAVGRASVSEMHQVRRERDVKLQLAISRLMKAKKSVGVQRLISTVVNDVSRWFVPKVVEIKRAIDHLVDKEYLARDGSAAVSYVM
jgi:cullin 1